MGCWGKPGSDIVRLKAWRWQVYAWCDAHPASSTHRIHTLPSTYILLREACGWVPCVCAYNWERMCKCGRDRAAVSSQLPDHRRWSLTLLLLCWVGRREGRREGEGEGPKFLVLPRHLQPSWAWRAGLGLEHGASLLTDLVSCARTPLRGSPGASNLQGARWLEEGEALLFQPIGLGSNPSCPLTALGPWGRHTFSKRSSLIGPASTDAPAQRGTISRAKGSSVHIKRGQNNRGRLQYDNVSNVFPSLWQGIGLWMVIVAGPILRELIFTKV